MFKPRLICLLSIFCFLFSCSKDGGSIDVSSQWKTDYNRNRISGAVDDQWQPTDLTSGISLFKGLDTANLEGTTMPDSVYTATSCFNCIFPNPFVSETSFVFSFSKGYTGEMIFKYVIVNNRSDIFDKGAMRIQGISANPQWPSTSTMVHLTPNIPAGQYRIYFTLSAESHPHFYQCWGNIEKTQ